jgi:hypothetical protein
MIGRHSKRVKKRFSAQCTRNCQLPRQKIMGGETEKETNLLYALVFQIRQKSVSIFKFCEYKILSFFWDMESVAAKFQKQKNPHPASINSHTLGWPGPKRGGVIKLAGVGGPLQMAQFDNNALCG